MLTHVRLINFRCFTNVSVRMAPLTVFVGANASGKSSFLKALVPAAIYPQTEDRWRQVNDVFLQEHTFASGMAWSRADRVQVNGTRRASAPVDVQALQLDINKLRQANAANQAHSLMNDGSNLAALFASLTRKEQGAVSQTLSELVPTIQDVGVVPHQGGTLRLRFQDRWKSDLWFWPEEVSDGTMLVLAYLLLQYQPSQVDLITIEEPERGLHPYRLGELVSLWRKLSQGKLGPKAVQVVLATHSAELLDHLEPAEVRFLSREPDGSVRVDEAPQDDQNWREAFKTYNDSLGSLWLSGGLGGVPGR